MADVQNRIVGIYKITSPTGRIYIGQSINILSRFKRYRDLNCVCQRKLHRSLLKYGWRTHSFKIIHELPIDTERVILDTYEQIYIEAYKIGGFKMLNIKEGGSNGSSSMETRKRQSLALKGRIIKELPISIIKDEFVSGTPITELTTKYNVGHNTLLQRLRKEIGTQRVETINAERKADSLLKSARKFTSGFTPWNKGVSCGSGSDNNFYGKSHSFVSKDKMRVKRQKKVFCLTNGKEYLSATIAATELGLHGSSVAKVARGYQKQHKGYEFKYL